MRKYELIYIIDARLSPEDKKKIDAQVKDSIQKASGKIVNSFVWIEKQRMSFPINKVEDGTYTMMNLEIGADGLAQLRRDLKLNETILRSLVVLVKGGEFKPMPKPEPKPAPQMGAF